MGQVKDAGHIGMVAHLAAENDGLILAGKGLRRKVPQINLLLLCLSPFLTDARAAEREGADRGASATGAFPVLSPFRAREMAVQSVPYAPLADGVPLSKDVDLLGQIGGSVEAVAAQGNYAYIGLGGRLATVGVANPAAPVVAGQSYVLPGIANAVVLSGTTAYVSAEYGGLRILDVGDVSHPSELGSIETPSSAQSLVLSGTVACVADWDGGLRLIDVTNPADPVGIGFFDTSAYATDVAIDGAVAYVADDRGALRLIDVSTPDSPTSLGWHGALGRARDLTLSG